MTDTNKAASPREELARIIADRAFMSAQSRYDYDLRLRSIGKFDDWATFAFVGATWLGQIQDAYAKADEWLSRHPVKAASPEREAVKLANVARDDLIARALHMADWTINQLAGTMVTSGHWTEEQFDKLFSTEEARRAKELIAQARAMPAVVLPALSLPVQSVEGEVVAWRTRTMFGNNEWDGWRLISEAQARRLERDPAFKNGRREVQPLYAAPPKPSEADQFAQDAKCSTPASQEYETALRILTEMDAENMPIEKRAAILGSMIARPNDTDRAWAADMAKGLPEAPAMGWKLVPVEPSEAMIDAALDAHANGGPWESPFDHDGFFAEIYRAMLAASTPEIALDQYADEVHP